MNRTSTQPPTIGLMRSLISSPIATRLADEAVKYASARTEQLAGKLTDRLEGGAGPGLKPVTEGVRKLAQGKSATSAAAGAAMTGLKEKAKSAFGGGGRNSSSGDLKMTNVEEAIDVGLPIDVVYNQWTQLPEFAKFMKGVEAVEQKDEIESTWRVKVFMSRRTWNARTLEQIPDRRIVWTSEGAKGSTKGCVSFHPLSDDLTRVLLALEYYPSGFFEKTGNLWRAGGRRARLDLKHFRRFISMTGEATGAWRGEIRDGEVVRQPDEQDSGGRPQAEHRGAEPRGGEQRGGEQLDAEPPQTAEAEPPEDEQDEEDQKQDEQEQAEVRRPTRKPAPDKQAAKDKSSARS